MAKKIQEQRGTNARDLFRGTNKSDLYFGEGGNDLLFGFGGADNCNGGGGNDRVSGNDGDDTVNGNAGNDVLFGGNGSDTINGNAGSDRIFGDVGDDTIDGGSGVDRIAGGSGDDNISGGAGNDLLNGGAGNDFIAGNTGDDRMRGGGGDDILNWNDGDGSDLMSGGEGRDTIEVNGSVTRGDNFVLGNTQPGDSSQRVGRAFFQRIGLDGQAIGQFSLAVDTSEEFDVSGDGGNDSFVINDLTGTGVEAVGFDGGEGNDLLDARNTSTRVIANGGNGDDILIGGTGVIVGANNVTLGDTLTGGAGRDRFQFSTDPFAGGTIGQNVNRPDVITDFTIGQDQVALDRQKFGIDQLTFQKGAVNVLSGSSNLLVLEGGFANAGLAAAAIRDNNNITAGRGAFVYFNQTLGFSRVVFSEDLANGGRFSVQANLTNLTNVANQANFTAAEFGLA